MKARIINGTREGTPHPLRWAAAQRTCLDLGFEGCDRSPAVYSDTPAYADMCGFHPGDSEHKKYIRGCMMAHHDALRLIASDEERGTVFEDDITLPDAPVGVISSRVHAFLARTADVDAAYIGYCHDRVCQHATAYSPAAAKKILGLVDWCSTTPVDLQLRELCGSGKLKCAYAEAHDLEPKPGSWGNSGSLVYQHDFDGAYYH